MSPNAPRRRARIAACHGAAFSLIEMLVVLAIILVLSTMMYGFGSRSNQLTQKKKCRANLQKMFIGLQIYANENSGRFPVATNARTAEDVLDVLVPKYCADTAVFVCPGSKDRALPPGASLRKGRISYAYYMGRRATEVNDVLVTDRQVDTLAKPAGGRVFSENGKAPGNNHHKFGGNFLYCDGGMKPTESVSTTPLPLTTNVVLLNPKS
jgi:prepilin-type N-terminal cleavage/methylation domain-containing protein